MGVEAEVSATERPRMSSSKEVDFLAEAERIRKEQKHFMKVPGNLAPIGKMKHEKEAIMTQMKKKTLPQLKEILERQQKLLANKQLVAKLPDRGAKARETLKTVEELINAREQELDLAGQLSRLRLPDTQAMEWRSRMAGSSEPLDSDDSDQEVENTLRLLAEKDLPASQPDQQQLQELDLFAAQKAATVDRMPPKDRFVPFACTARASSRGSTPNSGIGSGGPPAAAGLARSRAEDHRYLFKEPPMPLPPGENNHTRLLTLQESLELQQRQAAQARQAQLEAATARLAAAARPSPMAETMQLEESQWRDTRGRDSDDDDDDEKYSDDENAGEVAIEADEA